MGISMIVDLASGLKERDAVSMLSASSKRGVPIHKHTHTSSLIGREMQSEPLYRA